MRENPWVLSTAVLGILSLILIVGSFSGGMPETIISEADAGKMILDFANSRVNEEVKLIGVETFGNHLYEVTLSLEGQYIPLYITKDGVNFVQGAMSMNTLMKKSYLEEKEDIPSENSEIEEIPEFNNTELNYSG